MYKPTSLRKKRGISPGIFGQPVRVFVVVAAVLLSAALAYKLPEAYLRIILFVPFIIAGALILLQWPPLGILIVIVAGVLVNVWVPSIGLTAALFGGLMLLWIFDMVVRKQAIALLPSSTIPPLLAFLIIAVLAFGVGQFPWYPISPAPLDAQIGGLGIFILSFCAFLLAAHHIRDIRWLKAMTFLFLGLGAWASIGRFIPGIGDDLIGFIHRRILGGSLFWTWLVAISLSQALFNKKLHWRWRLFFGLVTAVVFYIRLVQGRSWSSGWVPGLVAVYVVFLVGLPRLAIPATAIGSLVFLSSFQQLYDSFIRVGDNEYSTLTRLEAWRIIAEIVKVNPILGLGPANYRFYTPLFPILGWAVQFNSHNNYVDIVAQTGVLGLIAFLWFVWQVGRLLWRLRLKVPVGGFEQAYIMGCIGGLAGTVVAGMLGDWVLPFVYNIGIDGLRATMFAWLFLGGAVALEQILLVQSTQGEKDS